MIFDMLYQEWIELQNSQSRPEDQVIWNSYHLYPSFPESQV